MALNFPNSPTIGQTFSSGTVVFEWNGEVWLAVGGVASQAANVTYVATPANNQIPVFTGTNTIEGTSDLTWDGTALSVAGNITVTGTVDGRDLAIDGTKLDGIEAGAEVNPTASEIKTEYESNADTNAFTDAEQTKLAGIESGATADQTASEILSALTTVDGTGSNLDSDLLDGQQGSYYLDYTNFTNTPTIPSSTTDISEGTNLYFTDERVDDRVASLLVAGSNISLTYNDGAGTLTIDAAGGGGALNDLSDVVITAASTGEVLRYNGTNWVDATLSTSDVTEGTNLYYTDTRANSAIDTRVTKTFIDALNIDADTLDGIDSTGFATSAQGALADTSLQPASIGVTVQGYSAVLAGTTASFTTADETKLDGIEAGATADQTASEILSALLTVDGTTSGLDADLLDGNHASAFATSAQGALADTALQPAAIGVTVQGYSAILAGTTASFTTADETKLDGIEAGAEVNTVDSVNSQTGAVVLDADDIDDTATTNKFATAAELSKLAGIESGATADQTASEILAALITVDGTGSGLDADLLDGQSGAHYLDYTNFTNTPTIPSSTTDISEGTNLYYTDTRANSAIDVRVTKTFVDALNVDADTLDGLDSLAFATSAQGALADTAIQPAAIGVTVQGYSAVLAGTTASFTTADETKLDGIEAGATADQTASEILAALLTVDGSTSNLDADLLDGQQGSYYLDYTNFTNTPSIPSSTTGISEGTNLYYTDERVDDRVAALLVAGTNITLTYNDGAGTLTIDSTGSSLTDTDDLLEGSVNLYFSESRVLDTISLTSIDNFVDVDTSLVPPTDGDGLVWDSGDSVWTPVAVQKKITVGTTAPGSPSVGDLWVDTN